MTTLNDFLLLLDGFLGSAFYFPFILLGVGLFFTLYLGFPQLRYFKHGWRILKRPSDASNRGDTTPFQALSTALSGTVGTGNIGGVAFAIYLGGPAALFWMWMTAFLGMTTKFVEVTLSHKYREQSADGTMAGGPMYFMDKRLNMKWLAVLFAIATVISSFGTGSLPQSNNIAIGLENTFGISPYLTGGILAMLLGLVIIGGIGRIAKVTSALVPTMSVIYVVGALAVIFYNIDQLVPSFVSVFADAFTGSAAVGGFLGASFAYAFSRGVNRGLFSNEAGQGSAPIAHASAKTKHSVEEGMVSILEPFIDTIIICTLTGMVILSSGVWHQKHHNQFQKADTLIITGQYSEQNESDLGELYQYLNKQESDITSYNGQLQVVEGKLIDDGVTIIAARSIAEEVTFTIGGIDFSGSLEVKEGRLVNEEIRLAGKSLVHSTTLTTLAFTQGYFGEYGQYIVSIGLLLFAFSTAIAWSYYGDRAVIYLVGERGVMPYRVVYIFGFFAAAVTDTTIVWNLAAVAIVMMTLPNLLGIMLLAKEMKQQVNEYFTQQKQ